jgi:predicted AlkP superfamily phosphohydrolase/phosphomutase
MKNRAPDQLLDLINNQMESRATVALNLMQSTIWDFTMLVFRGTDTAQHFLFHRQDLLLKCYQKVDTLINRIMTAYPQATYIIVSDHGFEPINYVLYPDNVLYNNHYLTPTWDPLQTYSSLLLSVLYQLINRFMKILPASFLRNAPRLKQLLLTNATKEHLINFHHTTAFSTADGRGIQICFKDKYPQGIVTSQNTQKIYDDLKILFSDLKNPQTGNRLVQKIYLSEEVYGKNAQGPPDLILSLEEGVTASEWIRYPLTLKELLHTQPRTLPIVYKHDAAGRSGDHSEYGIFFTKGSNIKTNHTIDSITVEDILPLIFSLFNLPPPHYITGKIPLKIFNQQPSPPQKTWEELLQIKSPLTPNEINTITKLRNKDL